MICDMQKIEKSQLENYVGKPVYVKGVCWNRSFDGWTVIYRRESGDLCFDYRGGNYSVDGFLPNEFTLSFGSKSNNCFSEFPSEGKMSELKYICVANCPELDYEKLRHCICKDTKNPFPLYDYDCPCGHHPKWEIVR